MDNNAKDFSMEKLILHWIWTYPACIIFAFLGGEEPTTLNIFIVYLLGIGGLVGFVVEFAIRLVKAIKNKS